MKLSIVLECLAVGLLTMGVTTAHAATVWDEAQKGDFSNDGLSPTPVSVSPGSNVVLGVTGAGEQGIDRDYFRITVPAGSTLTALQLLNNTSVSGGVSFIGIQAGPQVTVTPSGAGVEQLIALGHYGNDQIGTNLLPTIKLGAPGPLPSGTYSIWVQETGGPASYGFDFTLSAPATPAPAAAPSLSGWGLLFLGGLLGWIFWRQIERAPRARAQERALT